MTQLIPIIQVVGPWVVKVDRQFHQPQTQHPGVEIDIALRVAGNRRHMMNAEKIFTHSLPPFMLAAPPALTSSRPLQGDGIPTVTRWLSCFSESCLVGYGPAQVLQPLHRLTPPVRRPTHS